MGRAIRKQTGSNKFSFLGQQAPLDKKTAWREKNGSLLAITRDTIAALLPNFSIGAAGFTTIDITRQGITKAYGLEQLSKLTYVSISQMLFIGDALGPGGNDAIVIPTGVTTKAVSNPAETAQIIAEIVHKLKTPLPRGYTKSMHRQSLLILGLIIVVGLGVIAYMVVPGRIFAPTHTTATDITPNTTYSTASTSVTTFASIPDLILVSAPTSNAKITSPLIISGAARGNWFFEGSAPVELVNAKGNVIAHGTIKSEGESTTNAFVRFSATLTFTAPETSIGNIVLTNDNPSGDPDKAKKLEIPVTF